MRRPSNTGKKRRGLLSKRGAEGGQDHSLLRPVGLLSVAYGGSHLYAGGKDTHPQGEPHARSPFSDEWHHARWQALHDRAGTCLQRRRCGALPEASHAPDPWKVAPRMGRLADPPGSTAVKDFLASGAASRV